MNPFEDYLRYETRRQFLTRGKNALGTAAMASLLGTVSARAASQQNSAGSDNLPAGLRTLLPHFAPKAKNVIYLHMVGGPSQMDLYDYKPEMQAYYDKDLPESIRKGQR